MKRLSYALLLFCIAFIVSCSDDEKIPAPTPKPEDPKEGVWTEPEKLEANQKGVLYFSPPKSSPLYNYNLFYQNLYVEFL